MIIGIDTSTPTCDVWLVEADVRKHHSWEAGRGLADGILKYLRDLLRDEGKQWSDIEAIVAYAGPGSLTGLRIGLTVMNTIADTNSLPIVGVTGDQWLDTGLDRLAKGESDGLVMPMYGREPNITKPRK